MEGLLSTGPTSSSSAAVSSPFLCQVRAAVPPQQLLVFDVREGWEPLCAFLEVSVSSSSSSSSLSSSSFLEVPVPDLPFPNINDAGEIKFACLAVKVLAWSTILVVAALLLHAFLHPDSVEKVVVVVVGVVGLLWAAGRAVQRVVTRQTEKSKLH